MADEQEPIAEVEAETPIEPEMETEQPESLDNLEAEDTEENQPEEVDPEEEAAPEEEAVELVEIERNGRKYQVPKELEGEFLMQSDYTKKTQETAALKRELEARQTELAQQFQASEEEMKARATLISIDAELDQFEKVDWDRWEQEDLIAAQSGFRKYQQLQAARGKVVEYLGERQNARTVQAQQETAKRLQETRKFAETNIKGWSPEVDAKITDFATKELGFEWDMLKSAYNPQVYRTLHLAWLGHQALNQKPAAPKQQKAPSEPLKTVTAKANPPARKSLGDMSMEEYAAYRQRQMAGR